MIHSQNWLWPTDSKLPMARTSVLLAKLLIGESSLVEVLGVETGDSELQIDAKALGRDAKYIPCGSRSERVHSRDTKVLPDLAIAAQAVVVHLQSPWHRGRCNAIRHDVRTLSAQCCSFSSTEAATGLADR